MSGGVGWVEVGEWWPISHPCGLHDVGDDLAPAQPLPGDLLLPLGERPYGFIPRGLVLGALNAKRKPYGPRR